MGHLERQTRLNTKYNSTKTNVRTVILADQVRAASEVCNDNAAPHKRVVSFCNLVTIWHVNPESDDCTEDQDDTNAQEISTQPKKAAVVATKPNRLLRLFQGNFHSRLDLPRVD